jgi:hypothetical protein
LKVWVKCIFFTPWMAWLSVCFLVCWLAASCANHDVMVLIYFLFVSFDVIFRCSFLCRCCRFLAFSFLILLQVPAPSTTSQHFAKEITVCNNSGAFLCFEQGRKSDDFQKLDIQYPHASFLTSRSLWLWRINKTNVFLHTIHCPVFTKRKTLYVYYLKQRCGYWILFPSSGKTYSVGPNQ